VAADGDAGKVLEGGGVSREDSAAGSPRGGGDDQVVRSSWETLPPDGYEQLSVGGGDVEVIGQDLERRRDVIHERLALSALLPVSQLDPNQQLGHGDRRDGDVVVVGNELVKVVARPLGVDQERGVEQEPGQDRSSTSIS
jgi:hypothetical protein